MRKYQIEQRQLVELPTAVMRSTMQAGEIGAFVGRAIGTVMQALARHNLSPAGAPFARYHRRGGQEFDVEVGFATTRRLWPPSGEVSASSLPGGPAAVMTYLGPYDEMEAAYGALAEWIADSGGEPAGDPWEVYFSDPAQEPDPERWRTEIVMPFRVRSRSGSTEGSHPQMASA